MFLPLVVITHNGWISSRELLPLLLALRGLSVSCFVIFLAFFGQSNTLPIPDAMLMCCRQKWSGTYLHLPNQKSKILIWICLPSPPPPCCCTYTGILAVIKIVWTTFSITIISFLFSLKTRNSKSLLETILILYYTAFFSHFFRLQVEALAFGSSVHAHFHSWQCGFSLFAPAYTY